MSCKIKFGGFPCIQVRLNRLQYTRIFVNLMRLESEAMISVMATCWVSRNSGPYFTLLIGRPNFTKLSVGLHVWEWSQFLTPFTDWLGLFLFTPFYILDFELDEDEDLGDIRNQVAKLS